MKTEVELEEIVGKTISGVAQSITAQCLLIAFTDGTFTCLGIEYGYDPGDECLVNIPFNRSRFIFSELVGAGLMTQEDVDEVMAAEKREREERARFSLELSMSNEYNTYLALKKKYEGSE